MKYSYSSRLVRGLLIGACCVALLNCQPERTGEKDILFEENELKAEGLIKYIDLVHCSHTDYGFTDHPIIAQDLQKRFFDIAIDAALATRDKPSSQQFRWTAEALDVVRDWWLQNSPKRQKDLLKCIQSGQIAINALPFHIHPFINERQWKLMTNWVDDGLWSQFQPKVGMQHDVNGFPRSAAIGLLDHGINYLWTGINDHFGGAPFKVPYAFWWKMPDNRKILVWLGFPYWEGYLFFSEEQWRIQQTQANNSQVWSPRPGDMLRSDEASVREAHQICTKKIQRMLEAGYSYDFITVSITNQWRIDNDGPFIPIVDFVNKWNELDLKPRLNLKTVDVAMQRIEKRIGKEIKTYEGEWLDWWSFGVLSNPRELAAARIANNFIEAASSTLFGPTNSGFDEEVQEIDRSLCRFFEHTFGSNVTLSDPYSLFNLGQLNEKGGFAFRSYEKSKWLFARRLQAKFSPMKEGVYVVNPWKKPYTGWVFLNRIGFRKQHVTGVMDSQTGDISKLYFDERGPGFWIDNLKEESFNHFLLVKDSVIEKFSLETPEVQINKMGWPLSVKWDGMENSLFREGFGDFISLQSTIDRWNWSRIWHYDSTERLQNVKENTQWIKAVPLGRTNRTETPFTIRFQQKISHPRLKEAVRILEIWKNEPRVHYQISFNRTSSFQDEIFYIHFPLPPSDLPPVTSNGGHSFIPYKENLPGTCMDYFSIDGWVHFPYPSGNLIFSGREASMITFDGHQFCSKRTEAPEDLNNLYSMIYNNVWEVNFAADCPGKMEFEFDLCWKKGLKEGEAPLWVKPYLLPPQVIHNPKFPVQPFEYDRMTY